MNRSSLFILCVMIFTPIYSFGMNRGLPAEQAPGITGDEDTQYRQQGRPIYTIFKHCGARYAYIKFYKGATGEVAVSVYDDLKWDNPRANLTEKQFETFRAMNNQLTQIQADLKTQEDSSASCAGTWLDPQRTSDYNRECNAKIAAITGALAIAFTNGGGDDSLGEIQGFQGQLKDIHQNFMHELRLAKMKFYAPRVTIAIACGAFGLYKLYQWWRGNEDTTDTEDEANDQETTELNGTKTDTDQLV